MSMMLRRQLMRKNHSAPVNLFNPEEHTIKAQHMINYTTGGITSLTSAQRKYLESYVEVEPSTTYEMNSIMGTFGVGTNYGTAFYDTDKVYISGIVNVGGHKLTFTTPAGCSYFRACFYTDSGITPEQVLYGITLYKVS